MEAVHVVFGELMSTTTDVVLMLMEIVVNGSKMEHVHVVISEMSLIQKIKKSVSLPIAYDTQFNIIIFKLLIYKNIND